MMLEETYRKLSGQEIVELGRQGKLYEVAFKEFKKVFDVSFAFTFGVDEIRIGAYTDRRWWEIPQPPALSLKLLTTVWRFFKRKTAKSEELYPIGYRLTVNGNSKGIYLCPSAELFRRNYSRGAAIVPGEELAGTIDHRGFVDVIFYVLPAEYDQFCRDAHEIFTEYCHEGRCFRIILDFWFSDMSLVQFIHDKMRAHPAMQWWLNPPRSLVFHGVGYNWYGPKFDR